MRYIISQQTGEALINLSDATPVSSNYEESLIILQDTNGKVTEISLVPGQKMPTKTKLKTLEKKYNLPEFAMNALNLFSELL